MLAERHFPDHPAQESRPRRYGSRSPGLCDAETKDEWLVHGFSFANYLTELGDSAQSDIYSKSSVDLALRDAFRRMRKFLIANGKLTEDEAISLITIGVDFGITQVVDGNWGVHAVIKKDILAGGET
jgi:acetamidase/formamidase